MNNMAERQGCRWLWYIIFLIFVFWFFIIVWWFRRWTHELWYDEVKRSASEEIGSFQINVLVVIQCRCHYSLEHNVLWIPRLIDLSNLQYGRCNAATLWDIEKLGVSNLPNHPSPEVGHISLREVKRFFSSGQCLQELARKDTTVVAVLLLWGILSRE